MCPYRKHLLFEQCATSAALHSWLCAASTEFGPRTETVAETGGRGMLYGQGDIYFDAFGLWGLEALSFFVSTQTAEDSTHSSHSSD